MQRYMIIGVYQNGEVLVLRTGRGDGPDHLIKDVIEHSEYHGSPYKTILLIEIGRAGEESGDRLNLLASEVNIVPPPAYTLEPAKKLR